MSNLPVEALLINAGWVRDRHTDGRYWDLPGANAVAVVGEGAIEVYPQTFAYPTTFPITDLPAIRAHLEAIAPPAAGPTPGRNTL